MNAIEKHIDHEERLKNIEKFMMEDYAYKHRLNLLEKEIEEALESAKKRLLSIISENGIEND